MRLTIFWRIILAQVSLIVLIVIVNLYALSQLHQLTILSQEVLIIDAASIEGGKASCESCSHRCGARRSLFFSRTTFSIASSSGKRCF